MFKLKPETTGVFFLLTQSILWGAFAIVINSGTKHIDPIFYAGISSIFASLTCLIYVILTKNTKSLLDTKSYFYILLVTLLIIVIPYYLFFIGASKTSGLNTSLLLLSEIIFTMIITPFFGERTSLYKIFGASGIFFGALFIMYNGSLKLNAGDLLIVLSTLCYPFGNFYAKKALNLVAPSVILFFRFLIGGLILLTISHFISPDLDIKKTLTDNLLIIFISGSAIMAISSILFYEGLKRLDISKTISLIMTFPISSLFILIFILKEEISLYKWIGIIFMAIGVYFTIKRKSVDPKLTRYAHN
ncbi:MAG: DMT family transporter [Candidatus Magasanikiibacteriota bacterium]